MYASMHMWSTASDSGVTWSRSTSPKSSNEPMSFSRLAHNAGQNECGRDDGADSLRTEPNTVQRRPSGLEQRDAARLHVSSDVSILDIGPALDDVLSACFIFSKPALQDRAV
jgi:hypothetical protein